MASELDSEFPAALAVLDALLGGLQDLLDPQSDADWEDEIVVELIEQSVAQARTAGLVGMIELLRIWQVVSADSARMQMLQTTPSRSRAAAWFGQALRWCRLELDADASAGMASELISLLRTQRISDDSIGLIQRRLQHGYRLIQRMMAAQDQSSDPIDSATLPAATVPGGHDEQSAEACVTAPMVLLGEDATAANRVEDDTAAAPLAVVNEGVIWISSEELELALDAIANQVLPTIYALADDADPDSRRQNLEDLGFNLGLVGSAMEMLGTPILSRSILAVQEHVESATPPPPEALVNWSVALVSFLEAPSAESVELLLLVANEVELFDADFDSAMRAEAGRIQVGMDPEILRQRKTVALPEDVALAASAEVLPQVLEGMLRELPGNAQRLGQAIRGLISSGDSAPIDEARRVAHTLKGDANTVGILGLANLTHSLEDLLIELHKRPHRLTPVLGDYLDRGADAVEEIADYLLGRGPEPRDLIDVYQGVLDASNELVADQAGPASSPDQQSAGAVTTARPIGEADGTPSLAVDPTALRTEERTAVLSVDASTLDELQRLAGETLVMARQIDQRLGVFAKLHQEQMQELRSSADFVGKLDDLVSLRGAALKSTALRGGDEVDPLELDQYTELHVVSRQLAESHADHAEYQRRLDSMFHELDSLRNQQESFHADLQRLVQRTRMVPFEQISGRLQRIVRQTSRQLERDVELHLSGIETLIESELLDRVVEPLAHLLRNAIDHGIESSQARLQAGKLAAGQLSLNVATKADSIEIRLADDGCGLDYAAIEHKARDLGLLGDRWNGTREELGRIILLPGFSTKACTTHVSGRGIGMDVVNQRIVDLRGQLELSSEAGIGTTVVMRLPVSRTMASVIIVYGAGIITAAVAGSVERVVSLEADGLGYSDDGSLSWMEDGEPIPVVPIESLYGDLAGRPSLPPQSRSGLLIRSSLGARTVVSVASVGDVSSVIVKPISPYLPPIPAVRGMTLLGDGRLAAVVDMITLVDAMDRGETGTIAAMLHASEAKLPRVVIADDSLSVRRGLTQLMEDAGFEVSAARDGLEALELIESTQPELVLLDLEMPKLNGLEVTRYLRGRAQTKNVPVLMISSRASDKYRLQADAAGVTLMLGKPVSEDELVTTVRALMSPKKAEPANLEQV